MKLLFIILVLALGAWAFKASSKNNCGCLQCTPCEPAPACTNVSGYYWKLYYGEVPYDAFGVDSESIYEPNIFIGLGHVEGEGVFPGALSRGSSSLQVFGSQDYYTVCENIMILCSKNKNLRWMTVQTQNLQDITQSSAFELVTGGFQGDVKLFIGRVYHEGNLNVGKVYPYTPDAGLWIINFNEPFDEFEILIYT